MDQVVRVLDTTLCDGAQASLAAITPAQGVEVAQALQALGIDSIEAGFPSRSADELDTVRAVAEAVRDRTLVARAACTRESIETAAAALSNAHHPMLHLVMPTSDLQLKHELHRSRTDAMHTVAEMVSLAHNLVPAVMFSAEDATRSDLDYLARVCDVAVRAGATTIGLIDSQGYALPDEYGSMFSYVRDRVDAGGSIVFSAHCHDELGLATANTLAALQAGARQVEVTARADTSPPGHTALDEVVTALHIRRTSFGVDATSIRVESLRNWPLTGPRQAAGGPVGRRDFAMLDELRFGHEQDHDWYAGTSLS